MAPMQTIVISDGVNTVRQTITFDVTPVNDAAVIVGTRTGTITRTQRRTR